jgi:serine phosphatase RsbU (regulator of sigma subunit)
VNEQPATGGSDPAAGVEDAAANGAGVTAARRHGPWPPSPAFLSALLLGGVVTAALALTTLTVYHRNEQRLLNLRGRELSLVLAATVPSIQTPLASAAALADATGGSPKRFRVFMAPLVGGKTGFLSASLWPITRSPLNPSAVVGPRPALASEPARATQFLLHQTRQGTLNMLGDLTRPHPSLGFAFVAGGYAVYTESPLPANRRSKLEGNNAFSDLDYAVYLGHSERPADLLLASVRTLPIRGRTARDVVPFGAGAFTLVITPKGSLGGAFFHDLPWLVVLLGGIVTLAAAFMTDRLFRRRRDAEALAARLDLAATEQRSISQTLQHALLPDTLPALDGLKVNALYIPAASGVDVGGDWYDVVDAGDRRALLVIGDVSGHGLRAATTMALVRHAALAYAAQDARPGAVLARLSEFVTRRAGHDYFATVLCALIDLDARRNTLASAGHMAPLLLTADGGEFINVATDLPIGVKGTPAYREESVTVPPGATLVAFTDGLVERRGEVIDVGLARLRDLATDRPGALDDLVSRLARELATDDHSDDTAIVGIQWQT